MFVVEGEDSHQRPERWQVWASSVIAVTIVSACSLFGLAIVRLLRGPNYMPFSNYFTGVAVGSLLGSALFNLLPESLGIAGTGNKAYLNMAVVSFVGVIFFYTFEQCLKIWLSYQTEKYNSKELENAKENELEQLDSHSQQQDSNDSNQPSSSHAPHHRFTTNAKLHNRGGGESPLPVDAKIIQKSANVASVSVCNSNAGHGSHHLATPEFIKRALSKDPTSGHVVRRRIMPIAWMVLIGDGLHNFVDGMSIGAAFSKDLRLGTTIATSCVFEELPHELGDFAILLGAGMTPTAAISANFLSGLTCFVGMMIGVLLGDLPALTPYIFAGAAGMFFYISLVDMMGDLAEKLHHIHHNVRTCIYTLVVQILGIVSGCSIIYVLAIRY